MMNKTKKKMLSVRLLAALLVVGIMGLVPVASCRQSSQPENKAVSGIHQTFEKGPVAVDVDVDRSTITVADRLELKITVLAPADHEVKLPDELPDANENEAKFSLVETSSPSQEPAEDGRTRTSRTYVLEPFLAGAYTIPAMTVDFRKAGEKENAGQSLDTEKIPITVTSLLPDTVDGSEVKPHDIRAPKSLPPQVAVWVWAAGIGAALLLVGLGIFLIVRKRRKARLIAAELVVPPHEAAFAALDRLMAENLIEKGQVKVFYQEISGILRRYIEARFGLRAPEQTTEEFLVGLKTGMALDNRYQGLLKQFLTHCDLVKFAAYLPSGDDIRNTIDSCRTFVQETRHAGETI
ncbi:MAG: BatD family protein [Desulfosalsimonadaceae bacterium]|nr:BatD family protein [Desulfosalsimonadaceae bacterium]